MTESRGPHNTKTFRGIPLLDQTLQLNFGEFDKPIYFLLEKGMYAVFQRLKKC